MYTTSPTDLLLTALDASNVVEACKGFCDKWVHMTATGQPDLIPVVLLLVCNQVQTEPSRLHCWSLEAMTRRWVTRVPARFDRL